MADDLAALIEHRFGPADGAGAGQPADGPLALFLKHRTHRRYADKPVPEELMQALLACALSARRSPTCNMSPSCAWRIPTSVRRSAR